MEEIEKILQTTGLSCDELLKKLQSYKTLRTNQSDPTPINTNNETCTETVIIQVDSSNSCNDCSNSNNESKELITQNINTIQCSSNNDKIDRNEDPGSGSRDNTTRDRNEDNSIAQNTEDSSRIEDLDGDSGHESIAQDLQNKNENLEACKKDEVNESNPDEALENLKSDKNDSISQNNQDGNEENLQNRSKDQDNDTIENLEKANEDQEESYNQSSIQSIHEDQDDDSDASQNLDDNEHQDQIDIVSVHDSSDDQDDDKSELSIVNLQSNDEDQDKDDQNDTSNEVIAGNFEATKENTDNKIESFRLLTLPNRNEDEDRDTANLKNLEDRDEDQSSSDNLDAKPNTNQDLDSRISENLQTLKKDDCEIEVIDGDLVNDNKDQVEVDSSELVQNIQRTIEDRDQDPKSDKNQNNSEASSVNDDIIEDMDVSNQSEEDLINNIKLQLSSLRNKKKTNNYLTDLSKKPLTKFNRFVKKSKRIAEIHTTIDNDDTDNDNFRESQQLENSGGLITATDETQFVIVNVTGGVDLVEDNQRDKIVEENCPNLVDNSNFPQMKKVRLNDRIFQENNANNPDNKENLDKSPFISDKLDDFLNENSQLKISYTIPKLGAEDGLMETMKQSPYDGTNYQGNCCGNDRKRRVAVKDATKPVKIRTLAEMRRHFETIKSNANHQNVTEKVRNSYVLYKNKKLWVASRKRDCLCVIEDDSKRAQKLKITNKNDDDSRNTTKKLSLLSTLCQISKPIKVHYKPGPLSKKIELQSKESCRYWKTELKQLPQIYFEVIPEINKPIDYRFVHLLPIFDDTIISKERADFAVSVLKRPQQEQQVFKFPVAYNNKQQQFLVRRQIVNNKILENYKNFDKTDPDVDVKNVVEDMLRYVEIREISDDLIKVDDSKNYNETSCNNENDNVKKNLIKKKRKRIDFELQRLNCKIINLENDNNNDDQYCNKPYCKLGCVCKSLLCEPILLNHCQLIDCMFECKCPKQQELLLDEHKMNHLNEQVKKNLAKVERDFTQTIIQQGNEMFIVGNTDDNKKAKRTSKAPKRYHDYDYDIDKIFETKPIQPQKIDYNLKECRVELINNNFDQIMPYCLEHFDYNCYCGGSMVTPNSAKIDKKPIESSARIRPLISKYRERNKHPVYQKKLFYKKKIVCEQSDHTLLNNQPTTSHNNNIKTNKRKQAFEKIREDLDEHSNDDTRTYQPIFEGEIQVPLKHNLDILKIIGPKNAHLEYFRILPWNYLIKGYNQNKLKIWCTVGRSNTLLCNKADVQPPKNCIDIKKLSTNTKLPLPIHNDIIKWIINNKLPKNVFPDETFVILTPTKNHFLLVGFCEKNPTVQERLTTAKSLEQVVSSITPPEITLTQILPSPTVSSTVVAPIENRGMKWKHKDMNNSAKILYITNRHFAPKTFYYNNTEQVEVALPKISKTPKWYMVYLNSDFTYLLFTRSKYTIKYTDLMEFINMSKNLHKTIMIRNEQIVKKYMNFTKFGIYCVPQYQDRLFIGPFQCDEDHYIDTLRYINGKLYDTNVFHQIQGKMNNYKKPLWIYEFIRAPLESDQSIDTIIIDPNCVNEINEQDLDDIDEDDVIIVNDPLITTIDVDDDAIGNNLNTDVDKDEDIMQMLKEFTSENLFMLPFVKLLSKTDIVQRKQTNRYIITNIPHLGYLEAYQHDTNIIDVFWPGDVTAYRFPSVNFAKDSLIQYFSQIFCPINDDYKISVVILNNLDLNANKPMDIRYLTKLGPYICGDFGVYSEEALTPEFLKLHNATSVKSLLRLEQRREENFDRLVQLFGMFLMTSVEQLKFRTTKEILDWAKSEIYVLKRLSANYESEKTDLQYLFRFNCLQIKKLVLPLPLDQRRKYYCRIMEIKRLKRSLINENSFVNKRRRTDDMQVTETIEIKDSDDDEDNQMEKTVEKTVEKPKNDMKVERLVKLARVGTVIQPLFQPINSSGVIQPATSYRSLLKNKFVPGKTLLIAKNCGTNDFKVVKKHEIVTNQDSPTKIVNIVNNITPEPT